MSLALDGLMIIFAQAPRLSSLLFIVSPNALPHSMDCEHNQMIEDEEHPNSNDSVEIYLERRNSIRPSQVIKRFR